MIRIRTILLALIAIAVLVGGWMLSPIVYAGKSITLSERAAALSPYFEIARPDEKGRSPVVLLFHGCGGLVGEEGEKEIMRGYAQTAVDAGYVAIIVDSLGPRGIDFETAVSRVCKGLTLRGRARAGDVLAAVEFAKRQSFIDAENIVLAGWSHGGWAVMDTMTMDLKNHWPAAMKRPTAAILDGLKGVYLTYPFCGFPALSHERAWAHRPLTSVVVAEDDSVVQLGRCAQTLIKMDADGVTLEVEVFENVTHAFDESDQTAKSSFSYDEAAASRAHQRFASYLSDLRISAPFPNPDRVMVDVAEAETQ